MKLVSQDSQSQTKIREDYFHFSQINLLFFCKINQI